MDLVFIALFIILSVGTATHATDAPTSAPIDVVFVDFLSRHNSNRHRTARYDDLVLRRGDPFDFNIKFGRLYNKSLDKIRLEFCYGNKPSLQDGSLFYVPVVPDTKLNPNETGWSASVLDIRDAQLNVRVNLPATLPIGLWRLQISTKLSEAKVLQTFNIRDGFYIITNAWSVNDQVYMEDEGLRQEYVLNEMGKIFEGTYYNPRGRIWFYGQFDKSVLPTVIYLLERTQLSISDRANVVKIARAVSAIVNSNDEGGLLVGDWSGKYHEGISPWAWSESPAVFRKYVQSGYRPVKFGQCWVFAGLTTTVLRTLGIPARTISNFMSAHDTDASLTVDKFFSDGNEVTGVNGDSIWNFHCWSDAWMTRDDLPPGYGGWQAVDATPQERSAGRFQLGPASLEAVKRGKVRFAYDVGFVFSEVNANLVRWQPDRYSRLLWRKTLVDWNHMGRKILTKRPGPIDYRTLAYDAVNIVDQYKYPKGTVESMNAYAEAARTGGLQPIYEAMTTRT
uniref:Hemocyte protein-glutamine gamma-glutamyltransferase n=1 Tax=Aceria tosichella TaxID=561515 RepID=A0A6G1S623_9ACAR